MLSEPVSVEGPPTVLNYDFDHSLGFWVMLTAQALRRSLNARLAQEGITLRQWEVLALIALEGELSQAELAERMGIEAPTLVGILDRMERDGWLDRYPCPQDRRRKRVRATEKAETVWQQMAECARSVRQQAIGQIPQDDLDRFKGICEQIRKNLEPEGLPPHETCDGPALPDALPEALTVAVPD